jgi:hypothetical protein
LVPRPTHRSRGLDPGLLGTSGLDLGHMRWNLVLDGGQPIADRFLACHQALTGTSLDDQPYWDLVSLFDLLLDIDQDRPSDIDADDQRQLTTYVKKVLAVDRQPTAADLVPAAAAADQWQSRHDNDKGVRHRRIPPADLAPGLTTCVPS